MASEAKARWRIAYNERQRREYAERKLAKSFDPVPIVDPRWPRLCADCGHVKPAKVIYERIHQTRHRNGEGLCWSCARERDRIEKQDERKRKAINGGCSDPTNGHY